MARWRFGKPTPERVIAAAGLAIGTLVLVVQFIVTIVARVEFGFPLFEAVIYYFSFFTILTNIALMLIYASAVFTRNRGLDLFRQPVVRGMLASAIALVMGFYHFILAPLWQPQGLMLVCDVVLHYVDPLLYLGWWAAFCTSGRLRYSDISSMLVPPLIYLVYVMTRGEVMGEYPYPVLNPGILGYGQVALNVAEVLVVLTALCVVAISVDRAVARVRR